MSRPERPPRRSTSLLVVLLVALVLVGIVQAAELLRHPPPREEPGLPEPEPPVDPRLDITCAEPEPGALVTSGDLLDCPREHHRRVVRYRGEVVGGVMQRSDGAWVQLNDDVYAQAHGPLPGHREYAGANAGVGAYLPSDLAEEIAHVGGPQHRGDVLEVVGEFRRIDHEHREVAVIAVTDGEIVEPGQPLDDPVLPARRAVALALAALALVVVAAERRVARRRT